MSVFKSAQENGASQVSLSPQIFLSYAHRDEKAVTKLYVRLSEEGFRVWMRKKDLYGGDVEKREIRKAIAGSVLFLACVTRNSITETGFTQSEIKEALGVWKNIPDGQNYVIPVRLEDCEIPDSLGDFACVDLFERGGWLRLVASINVALERRKKIKQNQFTIDIEEPRPSQRNEKLFKNALARFLSIPPDAILVISIERLGLKVNFELPDASVERFTNARKGGDRRLLRCFALLTAPRSAGKRTSK